LDKTTKPNPTQAIPDATAGIDLSATSREERARLVAELFREHNRALVSFLRTKLHNDAEAREVAQEAYVKLLQLEAPGVVGFLQAYLFKIAANLAVDRIRRQVVGDRLVQEDAMLFVEMDEAASPERICFGRHELERISKALETLPEKCREAFALHVLLERPIKEVAAELNISTRMVGYYLADAMEICRRARSDSSEDQS
jgi:RNA polymerase sigma factor (sigma-70 family)